MQITFVSTNSRFLFCIEELCKLPNVSCKYGELSQTTGIPHNVALLEECDCLGSACDSDLTRWQIRNLGIRTKLNRPILPIGSAIVTERARGKPTLVSVATTFSQGQDVDATQNVYNSFRAALCAVKKYNEHYGIGTIRQLMCREVCCGDVAFTDALDGGLQIASAITDFFAGRNVPEDAAPPDNPCAFVTPYEDIMKSQPRNFANREFLGD